MKRNEKTWGQRIGALFLAVALVLTTCIPSTLTVNAEEPEEKTVTVKVQYQNGDSVKSVTLNNTKRESDSGKYELSGTVGSSLEYSIQKNGYETVSGTHTVNEDDNIVEKKITLSAISLTSTVNTSVKVGDKQSLKINNEVSDGTYTWETSNDRVISLSSMSGTTTALQANAEGSATVKLKVTDGHGGEKTKEFTINVTKNVPDLKLNVTPENGDNKTSVAMSVSGLDGETSGTIEYWVNGDKKATKSYNETSWTYNPGSVIKGDVKFQVKFSGGTKYSDKSSAEVKKNYKATENISFKNADIKTVNGEAQLELSTDDLKESSESTFKINLENTQGREIDFKSNKTGYVGVDNSGNLTFQNIRPGEATITIYAKENGEYAKSNELTLNVLVKKVLDANKSDCPLSYDSEKNTKVYDGETNFSLYANLTGQNNLPYGIEDEKAEFKFDSTLDDATAGASKNVTINNANPTIMMGSVDVAKYYELQNFNEKKIEGKSTVSRREVFAGTKALEVTYGHDFKKDDVETEKPSDLFTIIEAKETSGLVGSDEAENVLEALDDEADVKASIAVNPETAEIKTYSNEIKTTIPSQGIEYGENYIVKASENDGDYGNLTVNKENLTYEAILDKTDISSGLGVFYENHKIFVKGSNQDVLFGVESGVATVLKIAPTDTTYYESVWCDMDINKDGIKESINLTADGLNADMVSSLLSGELYLKKNNVETVKATGFTIAVDSDSPEVTMGEWTVGTKFVDGFGSIITFNTYKKEQVYLDVTVKDEPANLTNVASGVDNWTYSIYEKGRDAKDEDFNEETLKNEINNGQLQWKDVPASGIIPVATKNDGEELETIQGYYIVLVKASDKVGNTVIYTSNGLVVDVVPPSIEVEFYEEIEGGEEAIKLDEENTITVKKVTIGEDGILKPSSNGDIYYKVLLKDFQADNESGAISSGIGKYQITLKKEDKTVIKDEITTVPEKDDEKGDAIESKTYREYETVGHFTQAKCNSNDLEFNVKTWDIAGNEDKQEYTKYFKLDATAPSVAVEYVVGPKNTKETENTDKCKNGKYFNENRTMKITVTERNFVKDFSSENFKISVGKEKEENETLMTIQQLKETYGSDITISDRWDDEQAEYETAKYTDDRKNVLTLEFHGEAEYFIGDIECTDMAGNKNEPVTYEGLNAPNDFVIDKTAPVVEVTYEHDGSINSIPALEKERVYTNKPINATVKITETNFLLEKDSKNVFAENQMNFGDTNVEDLYLKEGENEIIYIDIANDTGNWEIDGNVRTNTFEFSNDANYTFGFTYTDLAGNSTEYVPHYFTVDKTAPSGTIKTENGDDLSVLEKLANIIFGVFKNVAHKVCFYGTDNTSGIASIKYYETACLTLLDGASITEWKEVKNPTKKIDETDLNLRLYNTQDEEEQTPNKQYVLYERVEDRAGNVTYIYPSKGVVVEKEEGTVDVTVTATSTPKNGIYNKDVRFKIYVEDYRTKDDKYPYSGIQEISYEIESKSNKISKKPNNDDEKIVTKKSVAMESEGEFIAGKGKWQYEWNEDSLVVDADRFNSNDVTVTAHVKDKAGNTWDSKPLKLSIDVTNPTVLPITFDNNNALNEKYYKDTRVATIQVKERNFDKNAVRLNITNTDGHPAKISGWSSDEKAGKNDECINTCKVTFDQDGDYTMTMSCDDKAGNGSNQVKVAEFTIDKTQPIIEVNFNNNNASNGKYYSAARTATITVNEHNFNGSEVKTNISAGRGGKAPGVNGWSNGGDKHSATANFSQDGDYSFNVNYTDLAGNPAKEVRVEEFTVDQTVPEISIFDIKDKSANNDVVAPGVKYSDINHDVGAVNITIKGAKHDEKAVTGAKTAIPDGQSIKMADFEYKEEVDDIYTMTARVADLAGNTSEQSVIFSVNRFGSNYVFATETDAFLEKYYNMEEMDLTITEVNVDTLENHGISVGLDGNLKKLTKNQDYTVKESGSEVSWKSYTYKLNRENFEKEGLYNVTIDSKDRATNEVNNKIKNKNIEFVIDKTAPSVVVTGVEDRGQYRANKRDIDIAVTDNVAMGEVTLYVDDMDEARETFDSEKIAKQGGKIPYTISEGTNWQNIKAVATDVAGNQAESEDLAVLVTANIFFQFIRNTKAVVATLAVVVAAVSAIYYFLIFKRRKKEEEEK